MLFQQGELRSLTPGAKMAAVQLTGVHVLLVITFGIMAFFLLFLFAKRQIMRFALRSHRGPHVLVGSASPGSMKEEIERRLDRIAGIKYEPRLLCAVEPGMLAEPTDGTVEGNYNYIYRMKAVDAAALLDAQLQELDPELRRPAGKSFRQHLTELREGPGAPLKSAKLSLCNSFADSYEHARHGQKPFGEAEYRKYVATLNELLTCIKNKIYRKKSHVTFQNVAQVYSNSTSSHKMSADSILLAEEEAVAGRGEEEIELDVLDADSSGASYETSV